MIRRTISLLLAAILVLGCAGARPAGSEAQASRIKGKIAVIPLQTYLRVRGYDGREIRGRLLDRSEEGFRLQSADTAVFRYADVKSVKVLETRAFTGAAGPRHRLLTAVIILGAILGIGFYAASQTR